MDLALALSSQPNSASNGSRPRLLQLTVDDTIETWYSRDVQEASPGLADEITKTAFERGREFHQAMFKKKRGDNWLSSVAAPSDIISLLEKSQQKYEKKLASRSKKLKEAVNWWMVASSRVQHYNQVISTVISSNPEYAAIVWGALGFLFQVTLNHEELSIKVAQAFAEIGSVLPELDFIARDLYPVQRIKETLAHTYAYIIEFCILATKWYDDVSRSTRRKMWHAFANPWPLKFEGIKISIDTCFKRLREQSSLAHQAETRVIHAKVSQVTEILMNSALAGQLSPNTPPTARTAVPLTPEQMFIYLENIPLNPAETLVSGVMMRDRRRARGRALFEAIWTSPKLQQWVSSPDPELLHVEGSHIRKEASLDFALDIVEIVKASKIPIVWYLGEGAEGQQVSATDILRSLVRQLIEQAVDAVSKAESVREEAFRRSKSAEDWLRILVAVAASLRQLVVIVDARENTEAILNIVSRLKEELDGQKVGIVCKVIALTCELSPQVASSLSTRWVGHYGQLDIRETGSPRRTRVAYSPRSRTLGSRSGRVTSNEGKLSFQQLWHQRAAIVDVSDGSS